MTKKQPHIWKLTQYVVGCALVLITTNCVLGQFYLQGGTSNWFDFEPPSSILSELPLVDRESSNIDRNTQLWLGAGYQVNQEWSFEAFYSKLPSTEINSELYVFYRGRPISPGPIRPQTISISVNTETTIVGVGAIYDFYVNDRLSIIGKAGVAYTKQDSEVDVSFSFFQIPPIFFGNDNYDFDLYDDGFYLDDDGLFGDDESTLDMYFALGVRLPIQNTPASVTATYQFISTPSGSESGLFVGIRWDL